MNKIKTVLKDFSYFLLKNKKIIIFIYSLIFITFGIKLIYSTISIDTEHALSNYNSLIDDEWLGLNRYSLRFFKMTIFPPIFNDPTNIHSIWLYDFIDNLYFWKNSKR